METITNIKLKPQPHLHRSTLPSHHCSSFPQPISSISFKSPFPSRLSRSSISFPIQSSSSSPLRNSNSSNPIFPKPKTLVNPFAPLFSLLKTPLCITVAAAAVFFSRFSHKPLLAFAVSAPTVETTTTTTTIDSPDSISDEDEERALEDYVSSHPADIQGLKSLMELKLKNKKLQEAIEIVNNLIELQPNEPEYLLLRAHMYVYANESELAKVCFEDILSKDETKVEAYHGLIMAVSQGSSEDGKELGEVMKRIEVVMQRCKKEKKMDDVRDFKLLIAQIWVLEGKYQEALKVYEELVKEEPRDFRPYLCQGIIYTLLKKKDEAKKYFGKYKRLVPKGHPYAEYFDENVFATKLWSQRAEKQGMRG